MANNKVVVSIPLMMPLFITFLVLKMTGTVAWSWWWVTAPLWIPFVLFLCFLVFALVIFILSEVMK